MDFSTLISKAEVLNEALPYIQKFKDSIVAIKFGGSAMEDPVLIGKAMQDLVLLNTLGMKIVVIHGGGKAISAGPGGIAAEMQNNSENQTTIDNSRRVVNVNVQDPSPARLNEWMELHAY